MKKVMLLAILMLLVLFSLSAKSKSKAKNKKNAEETKTAPEWVLNPTVQFPKAKYLVSVGEGKNKTLSEINAINNLASVFSQNVQSTTTSNRRMEQASMDGKVANVDTASIDQDVKRKVNVDDLVGVEIKETWSDGKIWYALAILEKDKTVAMYSSMLQKNNDVVKELMNVDKSDTVNFCSFETYGRLDFAKDVATRNEVCLSRLSVLNPSVAANFQKSLVTQKQVQAILLEISQNIPIYVAFENDVDSRFKVALAKAVSDSGFKTSDLPTERYSLLGTVTFSESPTKDGKTINCTWNVKATLSDTGLSANLLPFSINGRDGGIDEAGAKNRAVRSIENKIIGDFSKAFKEYLSSIAAY